MTSRHYGILVPKIQSIAIVGCGGIGSPTALLLAKMGFKNIHVYDDDTVDEVNIGSQLYKIQDVGRLKVDALKEQVMDFAGVEITIHPERTDGKGVMAELLIIAVDCIDARKEIAQNAQYDYLIDGRMGGETYSVFSYPKMLVDDYLADHFFEKSEAAPVPCTAKAIVYNTFGCASLIASTAKTINNLEVPPTEQHFCFLNKEYIQQ